MYEDHCAGKKHKKREREAKIYDCDICGIYCITADEQREHFETSLHKESVQVREYLASQQNKVDNDANGAAADAEILGLQELNDIKMSVGITKGLYKICSLCKVHTNSKQMWDTVRHFLTL